MTENITTFDELLLHLVNAGFDITLKKGTNGFAYEIHTGAKSNLTISKHSVYLCTCEARYDRHICADDYTDFLYELKSCLCGRDHANGVFFEFLEKEGLVTKRVETKVGYV